VCLRHDTPSVLGLMCGGAVLVRSRCNKAAVEDSEMKMRNDVPGNLE
jgi:hypothetical protein